MPESFNPDALHCSRCPCCSPPDSGARGARIQEATAATCGADLAAWRSRSRARRGLQREPHHVWFALDVSSSISRILA